MVRRNSISSRRLLQIGGAILIACAVGLFVSKQPAVRPSILASKSDPRPSPVFTHSEQVGPNRESLCKWAAGLDDAKLFFRLRQGVPDLAALQDGPEAREARLLLTVLAMEAGRRDIEKVLGEFHHMVGNIHRIPDPVIQRNLVAAALAGLAETDPADAWRRINLVHDQAIAGGCGTAAILWSGGQFFLADEMANPHQIRTYATSPGLKFPISWTSGQGSMVESPTSRAATSLIFRHWTETDPAAALEAIRAFPGIGPNGTARFTDAIRAFAESCPPDMLAELKTEAVAFQSAAGPTITHETPAVTRDPTLGVLLAVATGWATRDFDSALTWITTSVTDSSLLQSDSGVLDHIARVNPQAFENHFPDPSPEFRRALADGWLTQNPGHSLELLRQADDPTLAADQLEKWLTSPSQYVCDPGAWPILESSASTLSDLERRQLILSQLDTFDLPETDRQRLESSAASP